jgi:hypothetical protein
MSEHCNRYKVWLRSVPGFCAQYQGYVPVVARDEEEAAQRAFAELRRTAFPDRGPSMWKIERVEQVMER